MQFDGKPQRELLLTSIDCSVKLSMDMHYVKERRCVNEICYVKEMWYVNEKLYVNVISYVEHR
jgi:hypothetical protein